MRSGIDNGQPGTLPIVKRLQLRKKRIFGYFLKIPKYSSCYNCNLLIIGRVLGCPLSPQIYLKYEIYPLEILQVKDPFNGWCSVWVAKILGIGDRPDVEEAGQPTHNDSFPISTERESTEFLKKITHGRKIQVHVC